MTPTEESWYVWQELGPDDRWGMIVAIIPGVSDGPAPLAFRERRLADYTRGLALAHGRGAVRPVRLARYAHAETIEQT